MRYLTVLWILALGPAFAANVGFNGRWDISYPAGADRASWLEVRGAETSAPEVRFVSAYAGDLNRADEVAIRNGELVFGFRYKQRRQRGEEPVDAHTICRAKLSGAQLKGTTEIEGSNRPPVEWVGVRAPEISEKDDGTWREGKPIRMFSGKDLTGWAPLEKDRKFGWKVEQGILKAPGGGANLVSTAKFWNFKLHIEYRVDKGSNSGIGLRGRYEVQVLDDYGLPPNSHSNGSLYSRIAPSVNASKPPGEWQVYDITLIGRDVTVVLNGKKLIDRQVIEGLTAMGHDPNEGAPGPISLQGDHGPIAFRNILLTPLVK
jgi:hypothetical protein